jgi:hypothetical protein
MGGPVVWTRTAVTQMFHSQPYDFKRNNRVGTFFTNVAVNLVFAQSGHSADTPCTDLSTARVDKDESPFTSIT